MIVNFERADGSSYQFYPAKVRCGGGYYLHFYASDWYHPIVTYDIPLGVAKLFSQDESIDSHKEIGNIKSMEILDE